MDILTSLPPHLQDLVMQHLGFSDFLEMSLVSTCWSDVVDVSHIAMRNFVISIDGCDGSKVVFMKMQVLGHSCRRYQHIRMNGVPILTMDIIHKLASTKKSWKTVELFNVYFHSCDLFASFLEIFAPTVEKLNINQPNGRRDPMPIMFQGVRFPKLRQPHTTFPKLRQLKIQGVFNLNYEEFLNCEHLKELQITYECEPATLSTLLRNNKLRVFDLSDEQKPIDLLGDGSLESCISGYLKKCNILQSLQAQADSMEILKIKQWMGFDIFKCIFTLHCLQEVYMDIPNFSSSTVEWQQLKLCRNLSIKKLHLGGLGISFIQMAEIIDATPNLTDLTMHSLIDLQTLRYLSANARNLKTLTLRALDVEGFAYKNWLPSLEQLNLHILQSSEKKECTNIPEEERSGFVQLILDNYDILLH